MKANSNPKNKIFVITAIAVVVLVLSVIAVWVVAPQIRLTFSKGGSVEDGMLPNVEASEHITDVPKGEIRYLINKNIVFEKYCSLGDIMIENPECSNYSIRIRIYDVNGKAIYESPIIKPGQYLERDKLSKYVESGSYTCSYSAEAYQADKYVGEVDSTINVTVK